MTGVDKGPVSGSPRRRFKSLNRGKSLHGNPLLLPIAYTVAASVEGLSINEFLQNPTKQANGLTALHDVLKTDGIVCFVSAGAEAETLSAMLEWGSYQPQVVAPSKLTIADNVGELLKKHPRIQIGVDVLTRLSITVTGDPLLVVVISGPATLSAQLVGDDNIAETLDQCGRVVCETARIFGENGAHVIMIEENVLPLLQSEEDYQIWQTSLLPAINVARFYHALPVLVPLRSNAVLARRFSAGVSGNPLICESDESDNKVVQPKAYLLAGTPVEWRNPSRPVSLLTSTGEISPGCDIADLLQACVRIRRGFASA